MLLKGENAMKKFILQADFNYNWDEFLKNPVADFEKKIEECYFYNIDNGFAKVDAILWEGHPFLPQETVSNNRDIYKFFQNSGIDMMKYLIDACHKRGIKALFHNRASEVDYAHYKGLKGKDEWNEIKLAHPDWVIKTWYCQGLWNFDVAEVRKFKIDYISKIMSQYDFDGVCVDFARHTPLLPPGRQWECRDSLTAFMYDLRSGMKQIHNNIIIGAKVPENKEVCRDDGFDIEKWIENKSVDFFEIGSRTIDARVDWYRDITKGTDIKLYPCWDVWHSSDAMHFLEKDAYRGIISNWFEQGADGVVGFNYSPAPLSQMNKINIFNVWGCDEETNPNFKSFYESFTESTDKLFRRKYMAERRGGYPYGTGSFGTNNLAPLPATIPNDGTYLNILLAALGEKGNSKARVRFVISNAKEGIDSFSVKINENETTIKTDFHFIDDQIRYPNPQIPSGRTYCRTERPTELLEISSEVNGGVLKDKNTLSIAVIDRTDYCADNINVERAEIIIGGEKE